MSLEKLTEEDELGEAGKNKVRVILDRAYPIGEDTPDANRGHGTGDRALTRGLKAKGSKSTRRSLHLQMGGICRMRSNDPFHDF